MKRFWTRRSCASPLETELLAQRPEPDPQFARTLARRVDGRRARYHARGIALAGALTGLLLVALAGTGGLNSASSGVLRSIDAVKRLAETSDPDPLPLTPAEDQYVKPGKGCGDKNHVHEREAQCKITVKDVSKREGNSGTTAFTFEVSLNDFAIDPVTVVFASAGGTATPLLDFTPAEGTLSFLAGTTAQTITVGVVGETVREVDETFLVHLLDPSANAIIVDDEGVGTIVNDD
jgi:hypothetical protein